MITSSEISKFMFCQRAWWFRYVNKLVTKQTTEPIYVGKVFHEAIYNMLIGDSNDVLERQIYMAEGYNEISGKTAALALAFCRIVPAMVINRYGEILKTAKEFEKTWTKETEFDTLAGVLDVETPSLVVDFKTTSRPQVYKDATYFSTIQAQMYQFATSKPVKFIVITMPGIRIKKNETFDEFAMRINEFYVSNDDAIFMPEAPPRINVPSFMMRIKSFYEQRKILLETKAPLANHSNCMMCSYKYLCAAMGNKSREAFNLALTYYEKKEPYSELNLEERNETA